ncbi:MAG: class I SAM-dependent RNA methyltransferase [Elusimicrobia bacterium]|nr:class I SAM-dependent RNA methyltransferase [Elusimicrobiota bacterium]
MTKLCRHYKECGGCSFQEIPYEEQAKQKLIKLREACGLEDAQLITSENIFGFRNKMEYSFEGENLGLHPRGKFAEVVDLKECPVFSEWVGPFLEKVREFARTHNIPYYQRRGKKGMLKYLILRESKFTGQKMVILVVNSEDFSYAEEFSTMVNESLEGLASVVLAFQPSSGDSALTENYQVLSGREYIAMELGHLSLEISPYAFFQPNSYQIENLYSLISENIEDECSILDLYSGIGSIVFFLDRPGRTIAGVESYPACLRDAEHNRQLISPKGDIRFINEGVRSYSAKIEGDYDYIIVDPPRGGMSYRIWLRLNEFTLRSKKIKKVFYVSCSLRNFEDDLKLLKEKTSWKLKKVTGVDQFVHTPHLEMVAEFEI